VAHGKLRYLQGYTPAMLMHESRILQVTIFGDLADQSGISGLQPGVTRRYDNRGRGRCSADAVNGELHESDAEVSGVVTAVKEPFMKILLFAGLLVIVLGIASLIVPGPKPRRMALKPAM
jgi:hypothetical protein